jgi:hypothetical protein
MHSLKERSSKFSTAPHVSIYSNIAQVFFAEYGNPVRGAASPNCALSPPPRGGKLSFGVPATTHDGGRHKKASNEQVRLF